MNSELFSIKNIPAALWGEKSSRVIIAVHGNLSSKTDVPIETLSEVACPRGYQVLSFDLPEHGDRKNLAPLCKIQPCIKDLSAILQYAKNTWNHISLFANSLGAYFSLLSYYDEAIEHAWFLSPVADLQRILQNMMSQFQISEEQLKRRQVIPTPAGQTLYWDDYCYVREHPISKWAAPTQILYGGQDEICEEDTILKFVKQFSCTLEIAANAEHYFHTPEQIQKLHHWLENSI